MRLATQITNDLYSINSNGRRDNRQDMSVKACALYYLDYLFTMKSIKAKFNGKVIPEIQGETIIKNSIKHLQSFLNSELQITIQRSSNSLNFNQPILISNNNYQTFINNANDVSKAIFMNDDCFYILPPANNYSSIPTSFSAAQSASGTYFKSIVQDRFNLEFADIAARFRNQVTVHSIYGDSRYRAVVLNQVGELCYSISKNYFDRPYTDHGYITTITGTGNQLALDIANIPIRVTNISKMAQTKMEEFVTSNFELNMDGIEFVRFVFQLNAALIQIKSVAEGVFRNNCANPINTLQACIQNVTSRSRSLTQPSAESIASNVRDFYAAVHGQLTVLIEVLNEITFKYNELKARDAHLCSCTYANTRVTFDFKGPDMLLMLVNNIVGYFSNIRSYSNPTIKLEGLEKVKELFQTNRENSAANVRPIFEDGTCVNSLINYLRTISLRFNRSVDSELQNQIYECDEPTYDDRED